MKRNFVFSIFSIFTGIVCGFVSLLTLELVNLFLGYFSLKDFSSLFFINEIGEELIKFLFISFLFGIIFLEEKYKLIGTLYALLVGSGFAFFEFCLIFISNKEISFLPFLIILAIHSITAFFLGFSIFSIKNKKWFFALFFLLISVFLHIYYNLFALNFS